MTSYTSQKWFTVLDEDDQDELTEAYEKAVEAYRMGGLYYSTTLPVHTDLMGPFLNVLEAGGWQFVETVIKRQGHAEGIAVIFSRITNVMKRQLMYDNKGKYLG